MRKIARNGQVEIVLAVGWIAAAATIYWWIDAAGILVGVAASTIAVLLFTRKEAGRVRTAHAHGYHAGSDVECFGPDCELLTATVERMTQVAALATADGVEFDPFPAAR